ncbi:MAG: hypothetical protein KAG97_12090, partial [Victivallales bacterium]|nr:hypothetical protein [Victivallales bacterium]
MNTVNFEWRIDDDAKMDIRFLSDDVVRIRITPADREFGESGLNRYGFIEKSLSDAAVESTDTHDGFSARSAKLAVEWDADAAELKVIDFDSGDALLRQKSFEFKSQSAEVAFRTEPEDDWIGLGDQTRERLHHRGHTADLNIRNVESYIPVPFFMSDTGKYGVLVNTTHRILFDMCATDPEILSWRDLSGRIDYYIMAGDGFRSLIDSYTALTGRPKLPPAWAFGLWYICRTQANDFEAVSDALNFRREEIPCDVMGLEPGWMETNYDLSIDKNWSKDRFPISSYALNGPHNFIDAIKRMGFKFELWLCQEYDLSYEEVRRRGAKLAEKESHDAVFHDDAELDEHFSSPRYSDEITKKDEPWF